MTKLGHFDHLKMYLSHESTVAELFALLSILFNVISSPCFAQPLDANASIINATDSKVEGMCSYNFVLKATTIFLIIEYFAELHLKMY